MFLGQIHSPANPLQGSAFSTYGLKPSESIIAFSVGDQAASPDSYITRSPAGGMPTVSISNGVLTFSHPQTHSYVGIGDVVSWGGVSDVYITKKISTRQWEVRYADGSVPDGVEGETLVTIDKVFSELYDAINGTGSGAETLIGGSDLTLLDISLFITCYEKASNDSAAIDITGWTTSDTNYVKVFSPNSIAFECNKTQRHTGKWGGFFINSGGASPVIKCSSNHVAIEGLCVGEVSDCNIGIRVNGAGIVANCIVKGFNDYGVYVYEPTYNVILANNIVYNGDDIGIRADAKTKTINCTCYGQPTGYLFNSPGANTYVANCLASNNSSDGFSGSPDFYNCASDDATCGSLNGSIPNADLKFYDVAAEDFRLTNANDPDVIKTGLDLSDYTSYPITRDAAGEPIDTSYSMGALHFVPSVFIAIGDTSSDLKTGSPTISVTDGVVTFSVAQTDDLLSAGCVITPGSIILTEKIDSTNWRATLSTGFAPPDDAGPTTVTSIKFKYDSLYDFSASSDAIQNLITGDKKLNVLCVDDTVSTAITMYLLRTDRTRCLSIYAPLEGAECNSRRRHSGVWNSDLPSVVSMNISEIYLSVTGLQIGPNNDDGIVATNVFTKIEECIVKECDNGIKALAETGSASEIYLANNIVYDCQEAGIYVDKSNVVSKFAIYNNTIYNCGDGIAFNSVAEENTIRLVNNLCYLNGKDLIGKSPRLPSVSSESNWTSDASGFVLSFGFNNDVLRIIRFAARRDFHINLAQHLAMSTGYRACADHFYQVAYDVDSVSRPVDDKWSIGADQYTLPVKQTAFFSVGHATGDLQGGSVSISISGSIATFSEDLNDAIGIGDKVSTSGVTVYLAEKGTSSIWRVVDNEGADISGEHSETVTSITRVSNSLSSAMSSDVATAFGGQDLVSTEASINVECYQDDDDPDNVAVSISGWTVSADYNLVIEAPYDLITQCGRRQRHEGVWSADYYNLQNSISINNAYVSIDGLQIDQYGVSFVGSDESRVERCIIKDCATAISQDAAGYDIRINANIIYGTSVSAIDIKQGNCNNNTAVSDSGNLYVAIAGVTLVNNIAQGSANNYSVAGTKSYCISGDVTAVGTGCKTSVVLNFNGVDDYHLSRDDFDALNYGTTNANNPLYDIDSVEIIDLSIGADCKVVATVDQYFSCGRLSSSLVGTGIYVTISGGVATFSADIDNSYIMIGDKLVYDLDDKEAYLNKKISNNSWIVVDKVGRNPVNVYSKIVNSIKHTFNEIEHVFDVTSANSLFRFYGTVDNLFLSLSRAKLNIHIALSGEAVNNEPISISGFETDEDNHFRVFAPSAADECNERQKHNGVVVSDGVDYARLIYSSGSSSSYVISALCDYTIIDGLIVKGTYASSGKSCIYVNAVGCRIINNILYNGRKGVVCPASDLSGIIANNIVYYCYTYGIQTSNNDDVFNNTVVDIPHGYGIYDKINALLINNLVQDTSSACYYIGNGEYCISDDGSVAGGGCLTVNINFKNAGSRDYNLAKADPRGVGFQLVANASYAFSVDAAGNARGRFWDIGALEYQATKVVYYSIGNRSGYQTVPSSSGLTIKIVDSIGEFLVPQISNYIVSGDIVLKDDGHGGSETIYYLAEKIDSTHWRVTDKAGNAPANETCTVKTIRRAFTSLSQAFVTTPINSSQYLGSKNLASIETQVNIVIPNDFNSSESQVASISSFISDADYFIRIFAPADTRYCNISQKHKGKYASGVATVNFLSNSLGFNIYGTDYIELSGIIIRNSNVIGIAVNLASSSNFLIDSNIIRNSKGGGILVYNSGVGDNDVIVNNIISNCQAEGIRINGNDAHLTWILNNTIVDCGHGIYQIKPATSGNIIKAYNNICQDSVFADFAQDHPENTGKFLLQYNISKDGTAGTSNNNLVGDAEFINKGAENFQLNADADSVAIDSAYDMQTVTPYYYNYDARSISRDNFVWDCGALERNDNIGSGSLLLGPLYINDRMGFITSVRPTLTLYLRLSGHEYDSVPSYLQFNTIADLNTYLIGNTIDNVIIYVEGDASFTGKFELQDRSSSTVVIETDPLEIDQGPACLIYDSGLIDDAGTQGSLTFENIKIYSDDAMTSPYLIGNAANTNKIIFINCIIQVNSEAIIDSAACLVEIINSILVYLNQSDSIYLYLAKNSLNGNVLCNSIFLSNKAIDNIFQVTTGLPDDYVNNCLTYNIQGGFSINATGRKLFCIEDADPLFTELETTWSDPSDAMASNFKPVFESPLINTGNDVIISSYEIPTDIAGNDRVFGFGGDVDIGPYEIEIHIMDIYGSDICSIEQVKIDIDRINKRLISLDNNTVYADIYDAFRYNQDEMEEFVRSDKLAIKLKGTEKLYELRSDKVNQLIAEFEAYYDNATHTVVATKLDGEASRMLGKMMDDDSYVLHFNEQEHKLYLFLNEAVLMGASGARNPVQNVRFGGNPTFIG